MVTAIELNGSSDRESINHMRVIVTQSAWNVSSAGVGP
jgi:hypothetical protein